MLSNAVNYFIHPSLYIVDTVVKFQKNNKITAKIKLNVIVEDCKV